MKMYFFPLKIYVLIIILLSAQHICGQDIKTNPILFADVWGGAAWGETGGFAVGTGVHYQQAKNIYTARYGGTVKTKTTIISPYFPLPVPLRESKYNEWAFLYGRRIVSADNAFSFSAGISYGSLIKEQYDGAAYISTEKFQYAGFPFEANIKWFKKDKKRFRFYGIIPIGPPSGFSHSIGFKFFGNISKRSYVGIGIAAGLGWHKKY